MKFKKAPTSCLLLSVLFLGLLLAALTIPIALQPAEAAEPWMALHFEPGQSFTFEISRIDDEVKTAGMATLWVQEEEAGLLELILQGDFEGQEFGISASGPQDSPEEIFINFAAPLFHELPPGAQEVMTHAFLLPWFDMPLYREELYLGWESEPVEFADAGDFRVSEMQSYAGLEGYLIELSGVLAEDEKMNICVNPSLPLPLMVEVSGFSDMYEHEGSLFKVELLTYQDDSTVPEAIAAEIQVPDEILEEVVEFFQKNGFEIGDRTRKAFDMMGASAGFGVDVEGDEVELYYFDPELTDAETLEYLYEARSSGEFWFADMGMGIPAVVNGYILMTGLEFGEIYEHPARAEIIEAFERF